MNSNPQVLTIIAQGVINSLFAKKSIRIAPVVRQVTHEGRDRFGIHLDNDQVSLIKVAVEQEEFFTEAVRKAVLRRLGTRERP